MKIPLIGCLFKIKRALKLFVVFANPLAIPSYSFALWDIGLSPMRFSCLFVESNQKICDFKMLDFSHWLLIISLYYGWMRDLTSLSHTSKCLVDMGTNTANNTNCIYGTGWNNCPT